LGTESGTLLEGHHVVGRGGSDECLLSTLVVQAGLVDNTKVVILLTIGGEN